MTEQSHILNRAVIFTEIPGSPKLPAGTRISIALQEDPRIPCDTVAVTPTGQRYEFKSSHIRNLVKTPWVDAATAMPSAAPKVAQAPAKQPENPYTIGDVASVEDGVANDTLPIVDVTGTSAKEDFKLAAKVVEETTPEVVAVETEAPALEASAAEVAPEPAAEVAPVEGAPATEEAKAGKAQSKKKKK